MTVLTPGCVCLCTLLGKTLFVPSITSSDGYMDFVRVYTEEDYRSFPAGLWGIPEPTPEWSSKKRQSSASNLCEKFVMQAHCCSSFRCRLQRFGSHPRAWWVVCMHQHDSWR